MKSQRKISPPRWATRLLRWYCRPELLEDLEGDIHQYFQRNLKSKGPIRAKLIYLIDVIKFFRSYTVRKPQPVQTMNNLILLQNYARTSLRNIKRNGLFSTINIVGLAVSMSVGLLLIAFVAELKSYDNFHEHGDRIFRVNSKLQELNSSAYNYASTSVLAGRKISETVSGIEEMTLMRRGFNKDIRYNDKVIPLRGLWADESFFHVFSFKLLSGNVATALKEPYSLALTQSSALKLFGEVNVTGKVVQIDSVNYTVTAVLEDPPMNSHMRFDMLGSFITVGAQMLATQDVNWMKWDNIWDNYVYLLLSKDTDTETIERSLARISQEGNSTIAPARIDLYLEPLREIMLSRNMSHSIGPTIDRSFIVTVGVLAIVVILSACFNYTNLSIAKALRRTREVGIRKAVGASRRQIFIQFIFEAVMLSLFSLLLAFLLYLFISPEFISMDIALQEIVTLTPTPAIIMYFIGLAILVGIISGVMPASFFSKINTAAILKNVSSVKLFRHVNLRKGLIVFQYTFSILFIVLVSIGYKQYLYSLSFDLGFRTENILTVDLQQNKPAPLIKELSEIPEVSRIARAYRVSSVGANTPGNVKYNPQPDSAVIYFNFVDEEYIPLHEHKIIAGQNFNPVLSEDATVSGIIINMHTVKWMQLSDPERAIGEELVIDGQPCRVIGVTEDFHHERVNYPIQNFAFRYDPKRFTMLNLKVESSNIPATMNKIEAAWNKVDKVHPLKSKFYEDHIREAYDKLSYIIKIIGFIAFLTVSIASLGLLGMVVYTTETRLKEISIRKVLGASEGRLVLMMSKGFFFMLLTASLIAIPAAYYFMDQVVFGALVYRAPIGTMDLLMGTMFVMGIAFIMIGSQTLKIARSNPATVLKNE